MERKGIVRGVLDAAEQFIGRKLWKRFTNFDFFGVRVAGREELILAGRTGRVIPTARGRSVPVTVGEDLGLREQGKDHGLLAAGENGLGLFFRQFRP